MLVARRIIARVARTRGINTAAAAVPLRDFVSSQHQQPTWSLRDYSLKPASGVDAPAPVSAAELAHLAQLSHLSLGEGDAHASALLSDVESLVAWVGTISTLPMDHFEPMYTPLEVPEYYTTPSSTSVVQARNDSASTDPDLSRLADAAHPEALRLRPDGVTDGGLEKPLLANASFKHRGFFVVPKVVDLEDS